MSQQINVTSSMNADVTVESSNTTQLVVTGSQNTVAVTIEPASNIAVTMSRAVIGTVANVPTANYANFAGNVTGSNQPNITSLGTLSNLAVSGNITAGNVSTPTVYSQGMQMQGYDYVQMQYSNGVALPVSPYDIGVGSWFYLDAGGAVWQSNTTGTLKTVVLGNDGSITANANITAPYFIGNIAGSNVIGEVANANFASYANISNTSNSVDVANVVGIGNIATVNLDGNVSNLLHGDGSWAPEAFDGNANYANFAGNLINGTTNVSLPNVDGNIDIAVNAINVAQFTESNTTLTFPLINTKQNIFIGNNAGNTSLTTDVGLIAIGTNGAGAGQTDSTLYGAIAIGDGAASVSQNNDSIAIGRNSGYTQGDSAVAIGVYSGNNQGDGSVAIGSSAGQENQGESSIAIGASAGQTNQGAFAVAIGTSSTTDDGGVAIGSSSHAGNGSIAIGTQSFGYDENCIVLNGTYPSVLNSAGANTFVVKPIRNAISVYGLFYDVDSGEITFDTAGGGGGGIGIVNGNSFMQISDADGNITYSVNGSIGGTFAENSTTLQFPLYDDTTKNIIIGTSSTGNANTFATLSTVAIGDSAGNSQTNDSSGSIAIGKNAAGAFGINPQGSSSIAIGDQAAGDGQGNSSIALGAAAGYQNQLDNAIAIGSLAGSDTQGSNAIAVGSYAGQTNQGSNSIALGVFAGQNSQGANTIILNATGVALDYGGSDAFVVKPVRIGNTANVMFYDSDTGEIVYDLISNVAANYANFAGEAFSVSGGNVSGEVANANYATYAGTAYSVDGANVVGEVANANYATYAGNLINGESNVTIPVYSSNVYINAGISAQWIFTDIGESYFPTYAAIYGNGAGLFDIAAANIIGEIANANYATYAGTAYSVDVANVSGIGNIATVNLDGNASNLLDGTGNWVAIPTDVANSNYANFAGEAFSVSGANVTSEVANANYATYSGTVITNAQPNITSVGILTGLVVDGDITPNSNISYSLGNNTNRFNNLYLAGNTIYLGPQTISANADGINFTGNIDTTNNITALKFYAATGGDEFSGYGFVGASNSNTAMCLTATDEITFYNNAIETLTLYANNNSKFYANVEANLFIGDGGSLSNITGANVVGDVGGANHANVADSANSVAGANVSGEVSYAATANSVAVANVSGIGNIATVNLDGNVSNILHGDGSWAPEGSNLNANYANFAGEAFSVTGSNVSGEVANANYSTYSGTAGVANSVAVANVSGIGNIATVNLDGNVSNLLTGIGTFVAIPTVSANSNYANFAGQVVDATQSNITTVGNLVNLTVVGNASANSIQLNTGTGVTTANVGAMFWDTTEQTVSLGMNNGVTQQIGLENYILVKAASAITDGQVVMYTGSSSGVNVLGAPANVSVAGFRPSWVLGIATQNIALNATGYITTFGHIHGLNTNAYNEGDLLFLSTTTPGAFTTTEPTAPNWHIEVGTVVKKSGGAGVVQVAVRVNDKVANLSDANITTPTAGQALVFTSSNTWINGIPNIANIAYSVSGANVSGAVAFATTANSVAGANVSGAVAYATTANSVAVANVSGIGNIAVINLTGSSANVLYGNGVFAPASGGGTPAQIANGTSNVGITTSGGNVTMGIGGTADVYTFSNTRITTTAAFQSQNSTPNALGFSVIQGGSGANGLTSTVTNQFSQLWNNASVKFETVRISVTDTASNANSILLTANTNNVTQFSINKSGNVNFAGIITGDGGGLSNIAPGNLSANVNFANTAGTVTTNAQPNITSVGQLSGLYIASNAFQMIQSGASTLGRFLVSHTPTGGLTANSYYSQFNQTWNNSSVTFTNFLVSVTDTASNANSKLFDAQTNTVSKFSITKSGNVAFAGVITGDGGGLSNISATATSISNGTSNITLASSGGNAIVSVGGVANVLTVTTTGANVAGTITGTQLVSNITTGTAPLIVTSTTQVANLNVATAGLATYATTANSVAVANVSGIGNIATVNLNGNSSQVLYGNGVFAAVSVGGTPGGSNTQLQFNNNGSFGGISTVTYDGSNLSLGSISNVKVTGGVSNDFIKTDGTGNLSFVSVAETLLVGTRAGPYTVPITNYTFQVTARTGNVTVYVN